MTNKEKFKEVFGFSPNRMIGSMCPAPDKVCRQQHNCPTCPFQFWWTKEYKSCFEIKEEFDD